MIGAIRQIMGPSTAIHYCCGVRLQQILKKLQRINNRQQICLENYCYHTTSNLFHKL